MRATVSLYICSLATAALLGLTVSGQAGSTAAREDFKILCADCHNADAGGNGPLAKNLSKIPPDLTRIKQRAHGVFDKQAVYDWILGLKMTESHGTREMPIWGDWLMDEEIDGDTSIAEAKAAEKEVERRVMEIVKYLESLQVED